MRARVMFKIIVRKRKYKESEGKGRPGFEEQKI